MSGRVIVTARCRGRGHVLAELAASDGGLRVRVRHHAALARRGPLRRQAGQASDSLDPSLSWQAGCSCGMSTVRGTDLAAAAGLLHWDGPGSPPDMPAPGTKVIFLDPVSR